MNSSIHLSKERVTKDEFCKGCHTVRSWRGVSGATHGRTGTLGLLDRQEELHDRQTGDSRILQEGRSMES